MLHEAGLDHTVEDVFFEDAPGGELAGQGEVGELVEEDAQEIEVVAGGREGDNCGAVFKGRLGCRALQGAEADFRGVRQEAEALLQRWEGQQGGPLRLARGAG